MPRLKTSSSRAGLVALSALAAALLLAGCVERPDTGLALQNVDAEVVFGASKPAPAAPPNTQAPPAVVSDDGFDTVIEFSGSRGRKFVGPPPLRTEPCPGAPPSAAAPEAAPDNARDMPAAGLYRWKRDGTQELTSVPGLKIPLGGFENRLIRDVRRATATEFRFQFLQPELNTGDLLAITYKVRTAATNQRPPGLPTTRTGEPDRGLSIESIERLDPKTGQSKSIFTPQPSVLLLPLPVLPGEQFQAVGVDPSSRESLQVEATVRGRKLVDACGSLIDGWMVEMTRIFSGQEQQSQGKYTLIVATQKGAMPIFEFVELQDANGKVSINFSIGQVEPDPEPQS